MDNIETNDNNDTQRTVVFQDKATSNVNVSSQDTLQQKQWVISRIERSLDAFEHGLIFNKEKFKAFANDQLDEIKTKQNIVLSVMAVFATILVGSLASPAISTGKENYLLIVLAVILLAMLGIFIFYSHRKSISTGLYWEIEKSFHEGLTAQNFMKGFLQWRVLYLRSTNIQKIKDLYACFIIVEGGITKNIVDKYNQAKQVESSLFWSSKSLEKETELIGKLYNILIKWAQNYHKLYADNKNDVFNECMLMKDIEKEFFDELKRLAGPIVAVGSQKCI